MMSSDDEYPEQELQRSVLAFDLEEIPGALQTDDPVEQGELMRNLHSDQIGQESYAPEFARKSVTNITLTNLKSQFKRGHKQRAMKSIHTRRKIILDDRAVYPPDEQNIALKCDKHYLDFTMAAGKDIGLDAILPRDDVNVDPNWVFELDLTMPIREWTSHYVNLGFSFDGCMLYIGRRGREEVWLAFAPDSWIQDELADAGPSTSNGPTQLKPERFRRFAAFINLALNDMAYSDVNTSTPYPDTRSRFQMRTTSNIL
jgi:hypothetical protein